MGDEQMYESWVDPGEAPWLRQQKAAFAADAPQSAPGERAADEAPAATGTPSDPGRYWEIYSGTD